MLSVKGSNIKITRGDSGVFSLTIKDPGTGGIYTPVEGDVITFTLRNDKKNCISCAPIITKNFESRQIIINPEDTKYLKYDTYVYDVQITFASGAVNTILGGTFTLTAEVS